MIKLTTKEILNQNLSRQNPPLLRDLIIIAHNIRSMHNIGSLFRSADAFGAGKLVLGGYSPTPPRPEISKTAIGAEEFVEWEQAEDIHEYVKELRNSGYRIIGLEQTTKSKELPDLEIKANDKTAVILGNEVTGIDDELIPLIDEFTAIPQYGHKHSLNVSVAAGVLLYGLLQKAWDHTV